VPSSDFTFDRVLGPDATQHDVFMAGVKDVVDDVLKGYNGTCLAYGQTGG
jgi:kinesin family protein 5